MEKFYVSYISTVSVSDKIFGKKYENQAKLKKTRKLWYLLSPKFRPLFLKINFWRGGRALDRIPIQLWDFLSIYFPNFLWSYVLKFGTFRTRRNYIVLYFYSTILSVKSFCGKAATSEASRIQRLLY